MSKVFCFIWNDRLACSWVGVAAY